MPNVPLNKALDDLLLEIRQAEGPRVVFEDIELFHTHLYDGEPLSPGDESYFRGLTRYLRGNEVRALFKNGSPKVSTYVLGATGNTVFFKTYKP
jgi:hypothetical protein